MSVKKFLFSCFAITLSLFLITCDTTVQSEDSTTESSEDNSLGTAEPESDVETAKTVTQSTGAGDIVIEPGLPAANADSLWKYINGSGFDFRKWPVFPGSGGNFPIQVDEDPHGDWVSVFVNDRSVKPLEAQIANGVKDFEMPYGSILVKENFPAGDLQPDESQLLSMTVLYKVQGFKFASHQGEWFFAMFTKKGEVVQIGAQGFIDETAGAIRTQPPATYAIFKDEIQAGKSWFCVSCHQNAAEYKGGDHNFLGDYVYKLNPYRPSSGKN